MKKIFALFILFSMPSFLMSQNNELQKYMSRFQYNKALELCKSAYSNSVDAQTLVLFAQIYNKLNLPDSALLYLNKINIEQQDHLYLSEKAISYSLLKNQQEANSACDQLLSMSIRGNKTPIIMKAIEVFSDPVVNKFQFAHDLLGQIQDKESTNSKYFILNGNYLLNTQKIGNAVTEFERAIFYDSLNPLPYYMLGTIYIQNRSYALSIESLKKSLLIDTLFYPAYEKLGNLYYDLGKNQNALDNFKVYCENNTISQTDSLKLASMYLLNKKYDEASTINNKIFSLNPNNYFCLRLNAYINCETDKNIPEAINSIEKMFSIIDSNKIITSDYEYRGKLYSKTKKDSLAIIYFKMALTKDSTRISNYGDIAKSFELLKKNADAAEYYQQSINHKEVPLSSDFFFMGRDYYIAASAPVDSLTKADPAKFAADSIQKHEYLIKADTAFGSVISLSTTSHLGYMWKARVQSMFDPNTTQGLALPFYIKTLEIIELKPEKFKKELIESNQYIAYYYYLQFDNYKKAGDKAKSDEMKNESLKYWQKIISIDPENSNAKDAIKDLNK
jgi:tetratricopeptide (TPR) repeat protein